MSLYSNAVTRLNNEAVEMLRRGYHEEAVVNLTIALNQLVGIMQYEQRGCDQTTLYDPQRKDEPKVEPCHRSAEKQQQPSLSTCTRMLHPVPIDVPIASARYEMHFSTSMYNRAMILSERIYDVTTAEDNDIVRASVSVLYNIAFIHHLSFVLRGEMAGMIRAIQMYSKILKTFHSRENTPDVDIVLLAIWNNLGHIYSQVFQLDDARRCFDQLRSILSRRPDFHCWLPEKDYELFVIGAEFQSCVLHLAPAA